MHRIVRELEAGVRIITADGELDAFAAPELTALLDDAGRGDDLVVDLSRVGFLDSTALGIVVRAVRLQREAGALSRVVLPRGSARRIFEITALDDALPVAASRADGLAELARS